MWNEGERIDDNVSSSGPCSPRMPRSHRRTPSPSPPAELQSIPSPRAAWPLPCRSQNQAFRKETVLQKSYVLRRQNKHHHCETCYLGEERFLSKIQAILVAIQQLQNKSNVKRIGIILKGTFLTNMQNGLVYLWLYICETQLKNSISRLSTISINNLHNNGLNY